MSELENIKETQQQETQCSCDKETSEKPVTDEKPVEKVKEEPKAPEPVVTGNSKVEIIKHELLDMQIYDGIHQTGVDFAIKNMSDITIATLLFEAIFYDKHGIMMDKQSHRELNLKPGVSRGVIIKSTNLEPDVLKSYNVRITKMTTTDTEKVQLLKKDLKKGLYGEMEFNGTLKNISDVETDVAVVATFANKDEETIGDKVILIRNFAPGKIQRFGFKFKPQEGDAVKTFNIRVIINIEEMTI